MTMVDVGDKPVTHREAVAEGTLRLAPETVRRIVARDLRKGDALASAKVAGTLAAKRVPDLVPFCHPLPLTKCDVTLETREDAVVARAEVRTDAKTGVEMEALTAVTLALLTVWDMVKEHEKDADGQYPTARIEDVHVVRKVKR